MKILIVGATSAIATQTARLYAESGHALFLVARDATRLEATADDLRVRGAAAVETASLDVLDYDRHEAVIQAAIDTLDGLDLVLLAHGTLPNQEACEKSFTEARREFDTNALCAISILTVVANYFEEKGAGQIAVISSVAGDRGRQSNYVYGAAKGALSIFLGGLRNRLARSGVHVLTIKPGFVDTPMTADFDKGLLWATPEQVARGIVRAVKKQTDVTYLPWFWRYIMLVIKLVPETVFKRLSL